MPVIPEQQPISDTFSGYVQKVFDSDYILTVQPDPNYEIVAEGELIIRYGFELLGKPHISIVMGLLATDYGVMLVGEDAWQFVREQGHLYPRSEIVGYRSDGQDAMLPLKQIDLALPIHVLAYQDAEQTKPIARIEAIIATETDTIAERLHKYLPIYPSIDAWKEDYYG